MNLRKKKCHLKMTELLMYLKYHTPTLLVDFCLLRRPKMKLEICFKVQWFIFPLNRGAFTLLKTVIYCITSLNLIKFFNIGKKVYETDV